MSIIWEIHITQDGGITLIFLGAKGKVINILVDKTMCTSLLIFRIKEGISQKEKIQFMATLWK